MASLPDYAARSQLLRSRILPASSALIVTHDYPDPDALASGAGLAQLLAFWGVPSSLITYGGFVGRAENRTMIRLLDIQTAPFILVNVRLFDRIIVVDAVPEAGNVSLPPETNVDAVFDHHMKMPVEPVSYFHEIRHDIGATSTLVTLYLLAAHCPIPARLATALFYGIKTDTGGMGRDAHSEDLDCYKALFDLMDHRLLARIENPERGMEFFRTLQRATTSMVLCDTLGHVHLGMVAAPDYVAEMADLFHSLETVEWTVCSGTFEDSLFFSVRCKKEESAGLMARRIARASGGTGGGHGKIGAGRLSFDSRDAGKGLDRFKKTVQEVLGIGDVPEIPLLPRY